MKSEFVDNRALRRIYARGVSRESFALRAGDGLCRTASRLTIDRCQASTLANPTPSRSLLDRRVPAIARRPIAVFVAVLVAWTMMAASAAAQVQLPETNISDPLTFAADSGNRFKQGSYEVLILHGNCYINQGLTYARCDDAVLWVDRTGTRDNPQFKIIAYLEGNVTIDYQPATSGDGKNEGKPQARITDKTWFGRFTTNLPLTIHIDKVSGEPTVKPPVYQRGMQARDPSAPDAPGGLTGNAANGPAASGVTTAMGTANGSQGSGVQQAQLTAPGAAAPGTAPATVAPPARPQAGARRLRAFPRSDTRVQAQVFPNPSANETIVVVTSGINLIVDGIEGYGVIDMSADRIVMWKQGAAPDLTGQAGENPETPLELYMEGNVIFRQGDRVIFADRMYYDVPSKRGIILQAEILTPAPSYSGLLRLRADVLRQVGDNQYTADRGGVTSSRLGVPTFELRSSQLNLTDEQIPKVNFFTGQPEVDPATGEPIIEHRRQAISKNNILYVGPVPVFYWPVMATDLEEPNYYLQSIRLGEDLIFGDQLRVTLNAFQLLGRKRPPGTTWTVSADYFSLRGPAAGTQFRFDRSDFFGLVQGHSYGILDIWGIHDQRGYDTLGLDRLADTFTNPDRGRVLLRDRQMLPNNFQFTFEVGYISDRNFLEQYFETEWDQLKNQSTGFELKQYVDNTDWSLTSDVRVNNFFTETNWLPRLDHYSLGKSLFGDRVTWFEHSDIGYGQFRTLTPPTSTEDKAVFTYLPWETPGGQQGDREVTAQELDLPFSVGVLKFTPYVMGQLAHWGQALNYQGLERAYGQVGVRASVPFWSVNPLVDSDLFNVHGIAHKVVLEANVFAADATQSVTQLPLYDTIDDNAILAFRRQFATTTFGGVTPYQLDPRFYAIRAGLGGDVTNPAAEVVGTMAEVQLTVRERWQTKRGPAANRKVVDWISLNTSATLYPDASRDDFGSVVGLVNYDFTWFVGDRVTVMSDGFYDFFTNGAKYTTIGAFLNRPPRSSFYAGVRSLAGPLHSTALISSYSYRLSPKWFSSFGTSYVLGGQGNVGENFNLTRIGEAFLLSVGGNVDASKGNVGFMFGVEPRFLGNKARFGATTGALIPPAGAFGLE